jgi:NitT/TauT family transport system substrate-binding protein
MTNVTVSQVTPAEYLAPLYVGIAFGEFQKENLTVDLQRVTLSEALVLMRQGKIQLEAAGLTGGLLNAINQTDGFRQVGYMYSLSPESKEGIWVRNEFFDKDGRLIESKIKGMRFNFATGGLSHSNAGMIARWLKEHGGYTVKDVQVVAVGSSEALIGMQQGGVDGSVLVTPFWKEAEKSGIAKFFPGTGYSLASYIMSTDLIKKQPDVAKAILRAVMRTQRTYLQGNYHNDPRVVAAISKAISAPETTITASNALVFTKDMLYTKAAEQTMQDDQAVWLEAGGIVEYKQPIPLDRVNDLSLAKDVLAGL